MINKNKEERGSIKNENGMDNFPAVIQLNRSIVKDFCVCPLSSKNIPNATAKEPSTTPLPIVPTNPFDNFFPNNPMIIKPIKGRSGTNQTNFIILFSICSWQIISWQIPNCV
jgi:hypothetical protein